MTDRTIACRLAERFVAMTLASVPAGSRSALKRLLLDYLGVALSGSQSESGEIARRFARDHGSGTPQARLIGDDARVEVSVAAFANAISSHSIELDDIDVLALFHFSPPVFSAALAVAEYADSTGEELLTALACGSEMMERLSRAMNPSLRNRGFHTTPVCGVFGATVAAAKLLWLSESELTSALGLAGAQAAGLMEMYGPSMQKRVNPGPAARAGVTAARLAQLGFTGADTIFEGERGVLAAYSDDSHSAELVAGLEDPYDLQIEFKPYSCARPIHNAIDCALTLRAQGVDVDRITGLRVARHPDWSRFHRNPSPRTFHEAQMSLPFAVAVSLIHGGALPAHFDEPNISDPRVKKISNLVVIEDDPSLPRGVSCKMTISSADGPDVVAQVDDPKGSIANPMSDDEIASKFEGLAGPVIGLAPARAFAQEVRTLESTRAVRSLMELAARPKADGA